MEDKEWTKQKIKSRIEENELDLSLCNISKVPVQNMLPFTKVTQLDLSCNKINTLPDNFTQLFHLVKIDLSKNALTELPREFGDLANLKILDLLQNNLSELPVSFHKLKMLQWLDLKGNPIQELLQKVVGDCLKSDECQKCAKNIVAYYKNVHRDNLERERHARKLEENRQNVLRQEEETLRQRKRAEKKKRLQDKKQQERQERRQEQLHGQNVDNEDGTLNTDSSTKSNSRKGERGSTSSCLVTFLYLMLTLAFIAGVIGLVTYQRDSQQFNKYVLMLKNHFQVVVHKISGK